ncbi:MAG: cytochrome P450 [Gammaproteobacteria bacterium]|nr:cytochrome P450 [Gammaproteobacteria bacterium]
MRFDPSTFDLHSPEAYANHGFPWDAWDWLRREAPMFWYERDDIEPFWVVTRHADVKEISGRPDLFINGGPRLRVTRRGEPELLRGGLDSFGQARGWDPLEAPDMTFMDDPRHRQVRRASSWAFTQGCMRGMAAHFETLAQTFAEEFVAAAEARGTVDFVAECACKLPLAATGQLIGLAPDDWRQILTWSHAILGEVEPEHMHPGETVAEAAERNMNDFRAYLEDLIHVHRQPGGGPSPFINRLVNAKVDGEPMNDQQLNGYLFLLIGAGNDTTRNAVAGGVEALLSHPEELEKLVDDPSLLESAADEILRWTSPVISFLRTATDDYTMHGTTIRKGETVGVFYPAANRDETVFEAPYRFDITRRPNDYLSFGFGAHFCLGTNLARAELRASLKSLVPILPRMELMPGATRIAHAHVSGYATLPVRLRG